MSAVGTLAQSSLPVTGATAGGCGASHCQKGLGVTLVAVVSSSHSGVRSGDGEGGGSESHTGV